MPDTTVPRPEYPRPQFVRRDWLCLNGTWQFEIDSADDGLSRGLKDKPLAGTITVPFCPESELSGVHKTEFLHCVWYRREITVPAEWAGRRVLLHFQACDYDTTVWVDGEEAVRHRGGFTPFVADLGVSPPGGRTAVVVVRARDRHKSPMPLGKQSEKPENYGCHYTRTTGIWQTVWLEPVPVVGFKRPRITPDLGTATFTVELPLTQNKPGYRVRATVKDGSTVVATATARADLSMTPRLVLQLPDGHVRPWSIEDPFLYGLTLELLDADGKTADTLDSYAGLRSVAIDGLAVKLNGKPVFQRLVLDQGYYADGILTAPTDEALKADITLSQAAGFNGARLHQKVFEERFLYWADKLGYLVWGEFADWGGNTGEKIEEHQKQTATFITQWVEAVDRDYSHPSVIGWCPLNETLQAITDNIQGLDDVTRGMWLATKVADGTRPVLDASGYAHRVLETDVYDSHDYDQNPTTFAAHHANTRDGRPYVNLDYASNNAVESVPYRGQPYFVSEFGGIWWNPDAKPGEDSWGYGDRVKSLDEFYARFEGLCDALLNESSHFGYCYTQLTDVYQEQNGIFAFDRRPKFDLARIKAVQQKPAAIEKE